MRNLKVLGVAVVAILAMSAVAASMASATEITSEATPVVLTGSQDTTNVFKTTAGSAECKKISGQSTINTPATTATLTNIIYTECTCFGFSCTVLMNGCDYLLHLSATNTADVVCPAGQTITLTAVQAGTDKCLVKVGTQNAKGDFTPTNVGSGTTKELTIDLNISGVSYTHIEGSGLGKCTSGSASTGTLTGSINGTGETEAGIHTAVFTS